VQHPRGDSTVVSAEIHRSAIRFRDPEDREARETRRVAAQARVHHAALFLQLQSTQGETGTHRRTGRRLQVLVGRRVGRGLQRQTWEVLGLPAVRRRIQRSPEQPASRKVTRDPHGRQVLAYDQRPVSPRPHLQDGRPLRILPGGIGRRLLLAIPAVRRARRGKRGTRHPAARPGRLPARFGV
jgi:hypothetical protein